MIYLDTSALVKLVVREAETDRLRSWLGEHESDIRFSSRLSQLELLRVSARHAPEVQEQARRVLMSIALVDVTREILERAVDLPGLRSLDAIHLATAMIAHEQLTAVVTYDERMLATARLLSLRAESP